RLLQSADRERARAVGCAGEARRDWRRVRAHPQRRAQGILADQLARRRAHPARSPGCGAGALLVLMRLAPFVLLTAAMTAVVIPVSAGEARSDAVRVQRPARAAHEEAVQGGPPPL